MDCSGWSDEALLVGYASCGDLCLFEELVGRYRVELLWFLTGRVGRELADDVFQDVLLTLHLKCSLFDCGRRFRPWLFTVAGRKAIDVLRREGRHRMVSLDRRVSDGDDVGSFVDSDSVDPLDAVIAGECCGEVVGRLGSLTDIQRECVVLFYFGGLGYREIGEFTGVPIGTIKSRMFKAMEGLRRAG